MKIDTTLVNRKKSTTVAPIFRGKFRKNSDENLTPKKQTQRTSMVSVSGMFRVSQVRCLCEGNKLGHKNVVSQRCPTP